MLNQLESLTERVGGSNNLVDRWLHVRKHLCLLPTTISLALSLAKNHICA